MHQAGQLNEQSAVRSLELGDVRLTYVVDGAMAMLPSAFFPGFDPAYWADRPDALDGSGRVPMTAGGLLVERDGRSLLIDAGLGPVSGPVHVVDDVVGHSDSGALLEVLTRLGHAPEDIEAVAFTHLHVDHTGWAFSPDKTFPRARYLVAAAEWAPHDCGTVVPGAPAAEILTRIGEAHTPVDDDQEIFPGVRTLVTPGHSPGHTSYVITAGSERVVVLGDVFHTPAQLVHPEWPSRPDMDHAGVTAGRRRIAAELARPHTIGFAFHFGDQTFGRLTGDRWEPVPTTALLPPPKTL
ncbi:glyoxylase-like metal-dependent hydrolase (beta-lactamase superfamily II) [Streptomyces sp. TLI_55]|uniref:MBL fold metallo-hydrolase n=1 Tax=Streptomyces sp. TLI_55 TaxID=1938861 RepID=UPI000BD13734|nr:MBL fold metallo-hydrolase [Streptomyces sp. TLI_55]SNX88414.1 glyoxylase-like metal-dependent hydrolase (beta-lactamase superfamily II) [Streptomyces sp. TLI_55]